jgi:hypothetical protein
MDCVVSIVMIGIILRADSIEVSHANVDDGSDDDDDDGHASDAD